MEIKVHASFEAGGMDADAIKNKINDIVTKLSKYLNLSTLEGIMLPNDFGESVINYQREHKLLEGYTKHNAGYVAGKILSYTSNGNLKQTMFLNQKAFETPDLSFCLINHELCHIHDNYMKFKMGFKDTPDIPESAKTPRQNSILREAHLKWAESVWSEYIANRLSTKQGVIEDGDNSLYNLNFVAADLQVFSEMIEISEKEVSAQIADFSFNQDEARLFSVTRENVSQVLRAAGRAHGHIHGIEEHQPGGSNFIQNIIHEEFIKQSYFENIWWELGASLQALYDNYPNWNGPEELSELAKIVQKTWNLLGVHAKEDVGGGIRVVPDSIWP